MARKLMGWRGLRTERRQGGIERGIQATRGGEKNTHLPRM